MVANHLCYFEPNRCYNAVFLESPRQTKEAKNRLLTNNIAIKFAELNPFKNGSPSLKSEQGKVIKQDQAKNPYLPNKNTGELLSELKANEKHIQKIKEEKEKSKELKNTEFKDLLNTLVKSIENIIPKNQKGYESHINIINNINRDNHFKTIGSNIDSVP